MEQAGRPTPRGSASPRSAGIDALKAIACQLIVLHHLAFYGPMADHASVLWPALFEFLARDARIAVQVFLVVGGALAARALAPGGRLRVDVRPARWLFDRYLRLTVPLAFAVGLAVVAAAIAREVMDHPSVPGPASVTQLLAHLLLLQDVLGVEALSAGVWYVSIDFQLHALLLALLWMSARIDARRPHLPPFAPVCVGLGIALSLWVVNRAPGWDIAAPYFFGAYGMGALVAWWAPEGRAVSRRGLTALAAVVAIAWWLEPRIRLAVAAATALCLLVIASRPGRPATAPRVVGWLARISYAVFLAHFPVGLLVNAIFERHVPHDPGLQAAGVLVAWAVAIAAGDALHRFVERPLLHALQRRRARCGAGAAT
ncbi:MAG: acyltransferase [Rubrivivax sp.]|jgi:peptidoglycan/LPS O-acetylase OafA/YrhL|nr:acyltransferase [Rubrivivax sp.]